MSVNHIRFSVISMLRWMALSLKVALKGGFKPDNYKINSVKF